MKIKQDVLNKLINNSITTKQNKYHNKKVYYDGHWFDSQKEKAYYIKLKLMEKVDEILKSSLLCSETHVQSTLLCTFLLGKGLSLQGLQ